MKVLNFMKDILFCPSQVFKGSRDNIYKNEILLTFILGSLLVLIKSFFRKGYRIQFFDSEILNNIVSALSIPQVKWMAMYVGHFLFVFLLYRLCKLLVKDVDANGLLFSIMAVSAIGILAQTVFLILNVFAPFFVMRVVIFLLYVWCVILFVWAIKSSQRISLSKATACLIVSALPFFPVFSYGALFPYLSFLIR